MIILESAGLSEIGKKRRENEDRMLVDDALKLYAVADGMGGHQAGEVASQLMVDTLRSFFQNPRQNGDHRVRPADRRLSKQANRLLTGIHLSNQIVYASSRTNSAYRGMGTTVAAVSFTENALIAANVGDSAIFLVRSDAITQLSESHTLLAERDALDPDIAERLGSGLGHVLTRAVGTHAQVEAAILEQQCIRGDILVLASDGLTDKASPAEIQSLVQSVSPMEACTELARLANHRGGDDNITTVVVKVMEVKPPKPFLGRMWRRLGERFGIDGN